MDNIKYIDRLEFLEAIKELQEWEKFRHTNNMRMNESLIKFVSTSVKNRIKGEEEHQILYSSIDIILIRRLKAIRLGCQELANISSGCPFDVTIH